jgi:hypothetical protein
MDNKTQLAFEFARDTTKELIAFASAIIALTITFAKDFVGTVDPSVQAWALWAWIALLASVFFGLWTLMALTGSLQGGNGTASIVGPNVRAPAALQILAFFVGLMLTIVFAFHAVQQPKVGSEPTGAAERPATASEQ